MRLLIKWLGNFLILAAAFEPRARTARNTADADRRPVSVADAIQMVRISGSGYAGVSPEAGFAAFSPDGTHFAIVTSRGNLQSNTNDYSLLLFRTSEVFRQAIPRTLASFSSSSNREGISNVTWSEDSGTIYFLGARGGETTQLYSIQLSSGESMKLTDHTTSLVSYGISKMGSKIVYAAEKPENNMINDHVLRDGIRVSEETVWDLIKGYTHGYDLELFAGESGSPRERALQTRGLFDGANDLHISPDGQYVILKTDTIEAEQSWSQYEDPNVQAVFRIKLRRGFGTRIFRYEIVDTQTGKSEVLLNSPASYAGGDVLWSPDSKSVLLCGVYLPLNVADQSELHSRRSSKFVVEIDLSSRTLTKVTKEDLTPVDWDPQTNIVQLNSRQKQYESDRILEVVNYRKCGTSWERLKGNSTTLSNHNLPSILLEQDLNLPPRVIAVDAQRKQKAVLLDLNPQFARLSFGEVEELHWTDELGNPVIGGLYRPPDYVAGKRYPLVIQTHGFDSHVFWIDGPYSTAFAAQPLASKGFIVLQVQDIFSGSVRTTQEAERAMHAYEGAIEHLDQKGLIDRNRVALIGFSRTCLYVKYTLTHSSQHFAAGIAADGYDGGYLQYLVNRDENANADFDSVIGERPFGAGLQVWLKHSPGFNLDKVQTPILLQALSPGNLLGEWEWFSGLRLLDKPVDLVYVPTGTHILVKPWDRLVSQDGSVDWLQFWLKGEEDPNPAKADQYGRWRELRSQLRQ